MCKSTWADEDPPVPEILLWSDRKTIIVRHAIKKKEKDLKKKKNKCYMIYCGKTFQQEAPQTETVLINCNSCTQIKR